MGKDNPGIASYSIGDNLAIGSNIGKGGGAPNNFTLGYQYQNPTIRRVETVVQPRLPNENTRSKFLILKFITISVVVAPIDVGPGSYLLDNA